jgi:hypothetical protein
MREYQKKRKRCGGGKESKSEPRVNNERRFSFDTESIAAFKKLIEDSVRQDNKYVQGLKIGEARLIYSHLFVLRIKFDKAIDIIQDVANGSNQERETCQNFMKLLDPGPGKADRE